MPRDRVTSSAQSTGIKLQTNVTVVMRPTPVSLEMPLRLSHEVRPRHIAGEYMATAQHRRVLATLYCAGSHSSMNSRLLETFCSSSFGSHQEGFICRFE